MCAKNQTSCSLVSIAGGQGRTLRGHTFVFAAIPATPIQQFPADVNGVVRVTITGSISQAQRQAVHKFFSCDLNTTRSFFNYLRQHHQAYLQDQFNANAIGLKCILLCNNC